MTAPNFLEGPLIQHKFAIGQEVQFLPGTMDFHVPRGTYIIVRQLPAEARDYQYRVRFKSDGHERILRESQLAAGNVAASQWAASAKVSH